MNIFARRTAITLLGLFSIVVFLNGCASTTKYQDYPLLGATSDATATVNVVRAHSHFGSAVSAPVYVNKYLIGRIGPGGHLKVKVPTGQLHVTSTTADAVVNAKAMSEYYFEVAMPFQGWLYAPDFTVTRVDRRRVEELIGR
jgi:hypothetical protein